MKKTSLFTIAAALIASLGLTSCASEQEKAQEQEQQRQEELKKAEHKAQKMEEKARKYEEKAENLRQEQQEARKQEQTEEQVPWADQKISRDHVKEVQEKLNAQGFHSGNVDGLIGPKTKTALQNFQESKELNSSGELNQETIDALDLDIDLDQALAE